MTEKSPRGGNQARTFKEAYGILQEHAETLRTQDEPNIDDLLTIVTESVEAYKVCKERIDAVEAALKAALDGVATGPGSSAEGGKGGGPGTAAPLRQGQGFRRPTAPAADDSDDVPF